MKIISVRIPFESTNAQILDASKELVYQIYKDYLGREPIKDDRNRFSERISAENSSVNDLYFDGKKYGSLATNYFLDGERGISFDFTPVP
ncbi:MAG: hypothetical protein ABUT20_19585 [Bacteroidota bacterium]